MRSTSLIIGKIPVIYLFILQSLPFMPFFLHGQFGSRPVIGPLNEFTAVVSLVTSRNDT